MRMYTVYLLVFLICADRVRPVTTTPAMRATVKDSNLANRVFHQDLLFTGMVKSRGVCGMRCQTTLGCVAFTFTGLPPVCRGHSSVPEPEYPSSTLPGAETWYFTYRYEEDWVERPCSNNSDCPAVNVECFKGKCLCTPGYFYSHADKFCTHGCPEEDLQTTYMMYYQSAINGYNGLLVHNTTLQECQGLCNDLSWCRTAEHWTRTLNLRCDLYKQTPRTIVPYLWLTNFKVTDFYQKTCA